MQKKSILVLGGARGGKSRFAQDLAARMSDRVLFVATAEALDMDMKARIEKHQRERPASWRTLELSTDVPRGIQSHISDAEVVLIDCLTLLVSNLLLGEGREFSEMGELTTDQAETRVMNEVEALAALMKNSSASFIIISNEVGLGLVPDNPLGRWYRDILGKVNQLVARQADEVYFVVAGIPMRIKG